MPPKVYEMIDSIKTLDIIGELDFSTDDVKSETFLDTKFFKRLGEK